MGMAYKWREGFRPSVNAQAAGEEIERVRQQSGGAFTPHCIVDVARDDQNPLHPAFEWNDAVAADHYRVVQARHLIGALVTVVRPQEIKREIRCFVSARDSDNDPLYTSLDVAMSDANLRAQVVQRARDELSGWQARYAGYSELANVMMAIEQSSTPELESA